MPKEHIALAQQIPNIIPPLSEDEQRALEEEKRISSEKIDKMWKEHGEPFQESMQKRNAIAQRKFAALRRSHPSFADPVWGRLRKAYLVMRDKSENAHANATSGTTDHPVSHWEITAENDRKIAALSALEFLVENAQKQFGRRDMALDGVRRLLPKSLQEARRQNTGGAQDALSRSLEFIQLGAALRNKEMTSEQILSWFDREAKKPGLSSDRLAELDAHKIQLSTMPEGIRRTLSVQKESQVIPLDPEELEEEFIVPNEVGDSAVVRMSDPGITPKPSVAGENTPSDHEKIAGQISDIDSGDNRSIAVGAEGFGLTYGRTASEDNVAHGVDSRIPATRSLQNRVESALEYAKKNVEQSFDGKRDSCIAVLAGLREVEEATVNDIFLTIDQSIDSPWFGMTFEKLRDMLIREKDSESLAPEIVEKMNSLLVGDSQCQDYIRQLIVVKARIIMMRKWLDAHPKIQLRVPVLRQPAAVPSDMNESPTVIGHHQTDVDVRQVVEGLVAERIADIPEPPEKILHIQFDLILREIEAIDILGDANIIRTKRKDIEKRINDAAAEALAALNYEDGENNDRVLKIQAAQQKLLHHVDRMLKDKERVADVDLALGGKREKPPEIDPGIRAAVEAERREKFKKKIEIMKASLPERAFNSVASAAHVVALALGLTAAGAALYELGENESDQPRAVVALDESAVLNTPAHESSEIYIAEGIDKDQDIDQDLNTPGPMPAAALEATATYESPLTDTYVVKPGDEVRKIVIEEIKKEGLKVTREKVDTLSHLAMEINGIPGDGSTLAIGTVLNLHDVHELLDEMAGKPKVAGAADQEAASSMPVSPEYAWTTQGSSMSPMFEGGLDTSSYGQYAGKTYSPYAPDEFSPIPKTEKAYSSIPTLEHPEHALKKGEYPFKIIHMMLRESGGNWSSSFMNKLVFETLEENNITEEEARRLPVGKVLSFKRAASYLARRAEDRAAGKKMRTIEQLKKEDGR